jgi:Holliday junction resolvase RusA-like endonuclease
MTIPTLFDATAPAGAEAPPADLTITVYGTPAPQGSKRHVGNGVMIEMSKKVKPWRQDVKAAALTALELDGAVVGDVQLHRPPLDGPLAVSIVFTVRDRPASKPAWWPAGVRWAKTLMWRPASTPDLSKLLRSTEDALTDARAWKDDARVVEYRRLAKHYVGDAAPDVLDAPGAVIRIWQLPAAVTR